MLAEVLKEAIDSVGEAVAERTRKRIQSNLRVACFSERYDSMPMWVHYADNHKGLCVEYDFRSLSSDDVRRRMLMPVLYTKTLFAASAHFARALGSTNQMNPFIGILAALHKSSDWEYESEWRLVIPLGDGAPGYRTLWPSAVYIGAKAFDDDAIRLMTQSMTQHGIPSTLNRFRHARMPTAKVDPAAFG